MLRRAGMVVSITTVILIATVGPAYAVTTTWIGGAPTDKWSEAVNWSGGSPGTGDDVVLGGGGSSTHDLAHPVRSVIFAGVHNVNGSPVRVTGSVDVRQTSGCLCSGLEAADGALDLTAAGFMPVHGFTGSGTVTVRGYGTVMLAGGTSAAGVDLAVDGGRLNVNGTAGRVVVDGDGQLSGVGTVASARVGDGDVVAASLNGGVGGDFEIVDLKLEPRSTIVATLANEGGVVPHSWVKTFAPDLAGSRLKVQAPGPSEARIPVGREFLILENASAVAVRGEFASLPEGALLASWGHVFSISYRGGDGNDVVVRVVRHENTPHVTIAPSSVSESAGTSQLRLQLASVPMESTYLRVNGAEVVGNEYVREIPFSIGVPNDRRPGSNFGIDVFVEAFSYAASRYTPVTHARIAVVDDDVGYRMIAADGGVFTFGNLPFAGSAAGQDAAPTIGLVTGRDGDGYWAVRSDSGYRAFGPEPHVAGAVPTRLSAPVVGAAGPRSGGGFWRAARDGGIFTTGSVDYLGSMGGKPLNRPIVGIAATPTGNGYWLVASDGGIFTFGDATFEGSTGAMTLNRPIVGMAATPTGNGYWLVASDGGIFTFGDATFEGSTGAMTLNRPIVGMAATPTGNGYWLVASDGGIFTFGDAPFVGSAGDIPLASPIVGLSV